MKLIAARIASMCIVPYFLAYLLIAMGYGKFHTEKDLMQGQQRSEDDWEH